MFKIKYRHSHTLFLFFLAGIYCSLLNLFQFLGNGYSLEPNVFIYFFSVTLFARVEPDCEDVGPAYLCVTQATLRLFFPYQLRWSSQK